jgi:hypothetical protein
MVRINVRSKSFSTPCARLRHVVYGYCPELTAAWSPNVIQMMVVHAVASSMIDCILGHHGAPSTLSLTRHPPAAVLRGRGGGVGLQRFSLFFFGGWNERNGELGENG